MVKLEDDDDGWSDNEAAETDFRDPAGPSSTLRMICSPAANEKEIISRPPSREMVKLEQDCGDNGWSDDEATVETDFLDAAGPSTLRLCSSADPAEEVKLEDNDDVGDDWSDDEVAENFLGAEPAPLKLCSILDSAIRKDLPSSSCGHLKSHFVGMGFSPNIVEKVFEENGEDDENLLLEALLTYSDSDAPSANDADKKTCLLMMKFSEEEVHSAINRLGEDAPLSELVDFIVDFQTARSTGETDMDKVAKDDHMKNEESAAETLFETMDTTVSLLQMGFTEDEVSSAIDNLGPQVPISVLAHSVFASRIAHRVEKEEDLSKNMQKQNQANSSDRATLECSEPYHPLTKETNASYATLQKYASIKRVRKAKHVAVVDKTASYRNHTKQARLAKKDTTCWTKSAEYTVLEDLADARMVKEEDPDQTTYFCKSFNGVLSKSPYFFYGNVVDVDQETWQRLSQFLSGIEPEHVNTQFFSAFIRKEGYIHNLPTEGRSRVLPVPPMTIEDAMPQTKRWWPSWDTRKQLTTINPETTGVDRVCDRLGKIMAETQGLLSMEQQLDILHQCKALNLLWVGQNKLSPIEPTQVEGILGYPLQHTQISGVEPSDRLRALKYCFQTDTLGYHLSVLKGMYPDGLRLLSVYSGIGGAEVALHRLGIRLNYVVSVETSEINQRILRRWWDNSRQSGELKQIACIEMLTIEKLESYIEQFGGFDIIIGGNPGSYVSRQSIMSNLVGVDLNLFFEFVRVFQQVRNLMGSRSNRC